MKIAVLCERADAQGGTETYLRSLLPALRARGDDVRVAARSVYDENVYGVPVQAVAWSDEHDPPSDGAAAQVAAFLSSFAPDAVVAHNVLDSGVLAAARCARGARFVYHVHDHRPFCPNGDRLYPQGGGICAVPMGTVACGWHSLRHGCAYGPRARTFGLIAIREAVAHQVARADATIALSRYVAELCVANGVAASRTHVVPPPLADAAFLTGAPERPREDCVLFAGRVMPSKGGRCLVGALSRIASHRRPLLLIAGDGPDLPAVLDDARRRSVRTELLGVVADMNGAYDRATLVAVPSLWGEPFGLVGIEAFARGRPVVAYDSGAIPEWLSRGGGAIVARGDEAALADAIERTCRADVWAAASARSLEAAAMYRLDAHVGALRALYAGTA